ncbi:MAG: HEAT repeat domain-containing protein [Candidatus Latescibacterota bacterium]|nr:MAG: HEAT repeat domain-containing protein [Candidatus Latescibacterota bacterium]
MKRVFGSIIDIRRGEIALTLLMFFYYYLLLVTYYFLKPARDSLFLVKLGAEQLPIVFILIALIVVPITTLYSRASRSLKLNQLINATALILIINLFVLRWLLELTQPWVFYLFYIWVSIFGILSTSQFWLLANAVFDATQAKRTFVLFGLGGIVGAFTGGEVTSLIVRLFGVSTENLLFFCMIFLGACVLLVNSVWAIKRRADVEVAVPSRAKTRQKESYGDTFKMIKRSRHLMLIVGIIAMTMATASFVDFQFKTVSVEAFPTKQELTSFLGRFYGRLSLISFLFQLLFSYRVLRVLGVGGVILFLPFGLLAASVAMLVYPGLLAGIFVRGADGVFKYSIDKTGRELLFLPVPLEVKKRTKIFIDMFVDRWFRGFAGLLLLLFVSVLGFSVRQLSVVVLLILAIWITMALLIRKEYVNAFRKALERREIDPGELRINIAEASTLKALRTALASKNERQIAYALEMLSDIQDSEIVDTIRPLLHHESNEIRLKAARVLQAQESDFVAEMRELLTDRDPNVQRHAMRYVCERSEGDQFDLMKSHLEDPDLRIKATAMSCAAEHRDLGVRGLVDDDVIRQLLASEGEDAESVRLRVAEALGKLNNPKFRGHLLGLMDDPSPVVVEQAIRSAGRTGDREFVPQLLKKLSDKQYRWPARDALAGYGDRIVGTLSDHIVDTSVPVPVRSRLCRVLSTIPTQHSVDVLISTLDQVESVIKYHVIKALNNLRVRSLELKFPREPITDALLEETESYYTILQILHIDQHPDTPAGRLLVKALEEKTDENLERIFRLLGLRYPAKDIYSAYLGIVSTRKDLRANAIEFLDNILRKDLKRYLSPIMDNISDDARIRRGRELFGVTVNDVNESLEYLLKGRDPWLKACAIFTVTKESPPEIRKLVEECRTDPHPVIRETAFLAANR